MSADAASVQDAGSCRLDMILDGSNPRVRIRAEEPLPGYANFYLPHCPDGITGVREYGRIVYENVYDNVDLELFSVNGRMKYNFVVRPGGRVSDIRMRYEGAEKLAISENGTLSVAAPLGKIDEAVPYTWAGKEGNEIASRFLRKGNTVSFEVAAYDVNQTLVIDPWATYFGGSAAEYVNGVATDGSGNVIITGYTYSVNIPVTAGAFQTVQAGSTDAFIVKYDASGSRLWSTYFGGSSGDYGHCITTAGNGDVIVAGATTSSNLPVTDATTYKGSTGWFDAFAVTFTSGGLLAWATYIGGTHRDLAYGVAIDGNGNIIIAGETASTDFPVTNSSTHAGGPPLVVGTEDGFIMMYTAAGSVLWATYFGGYGRNAVTGVAIDSYGDVLIAGHTSSTVFPVTNSSVYAGGDYDAFAAKLSGGGSVVWATYCGGGGTDRAHGVACDGNGNVFITGETSSTNFPVTAGASQTTFAGIADAFLVKYAASGMVQWSTYCGGNGADLAMGCVTDGSGNFIITGYTISANFPVTNASHYAGGVGWDAFIVKYSSSGAITWASYYGGTSEDKAHGVAADIGGNMIITGETNSSNFPVTDASSNAGSYDAFVVHFDAAGAVPVELVSFRAEYITEETILVEWTTASETNNFGFEVQRSYDPGVGKWNTRGCVAGAGSAQSLQTYSWTDTVTGGWSSHRSIFYRLTQVDFDGSHQCSPIVQVFPLHAPGMPALQALYPQPAEHSAVIQFVLHREDAISIMIHDMLGRTVATLVKSRLFRAGSYAVTVHWQDIPPGIYLLQLRGSDGTDIRKITIL
ncbi:MAG: SBBP repeat-containing protein [Bacteroidetes bacterium]|nr:SBBP repeat-containing protein [Bacteroidota bacterium]